MQLSGKYLFYITISMISLCGEMVYANGGTTIINNNNPVPQLDDAPPPPPSPQGPSSCNNASDSHGRAAGVYTTQNGDGSSQTLYTTGDKKPYIVDPCNNAQPPIMPQVYVNPPGGNGNLPMVNPAPIR